MYDKGQQMKAIGKIDSLLKTILYSDLERGLVPVYRMAGNIFLDLITDTGVILGDKQLSCMVFYGEYSEENIKEGKEIIRLNIKQEITRLLLRVPDSPFSGYKILDIQSGPSMEFILSQKC